MLDNSQKSNKFVCNENSNKKSSQVEFGSCHEVHCREQDFKNRLERRIRTAENECKRPLSLHERQDIENRFALDYAKENELWIDDFYSLGNRILVGGNENTLVADEKNVVVYKANNLMNAQGSIYILLGMIEIHNQLFPETAYKLIGFSGLDNGANRAPYIEVVLRQDYISKATQATKEEIFDFMQYRGFEKINDTTFQKGEYIVSDLFPRNVLKNERGSIFVVDDTIKLNNELS